MKKIVNFFCLLYCLLLINKIYAFNIVVIGSGYVGTVVGAGFSVIGNNQVICVDNDFEKINKLKKGEIPFYEKDLSEIVKKGLQSKRLKFSKYLKKHLNKADIIYIAVGTPMSKNIKADTSFLYDALLEISHNLKKYVIIVIKSTVPIGECRKIKKFMQDNTKVDFDVVSNPEFLREGSAIYDFFHPDRVVIGSDSKEALLTIKELHNHWIKKKIPCVETDLETSETIKYASNAFLAIKVAFINEVSNLCDKTGADIYKVSYGMGLDKRIGDKFLNPSPGFGGSCFPKDSNALLYSAGKFGVDLKVVKACLDANEFQKAYVVNKAETILGDLKNKVVAVLGLAFKPNTDDVRNSPAIVIINSLKSKGAIINAHDRLAVENMKKLIPDINYFYNCREAIKDVDLILILSNEEIYHSILKFDKPVVNTCINTLKL